MRRNQTSFAVIPYIQGITEPSREFWIATTLKLLKKFQTLQHIFVKPKDTITKEQQTDAI